MALTWNSIVTSILPKGRNVSFFSLEKQRKFCDLPCNYNWASKLAYLVDIFDHLNKINSNKQGKIENFLSLFDKMRALKEKLQVCSVRMRSKP